MRLPELTNDQITLLLLLLAAGMVIFVIWLGTRESTRWQALQDRAGQAEERVNQAADPLLPYTRIPTAEIRCEEPADGYCGRYVLYRLTAAD